MGSSRVLHVTAALVVLAGCSAEQVPPRSVPPSPNASEETFGGRRCDAAIPFEPTYLPKGFDRRLIEGPAPGGRPPDGKKQAIFHVRGSDGRAIEVRRPGTLFAELAQSDNVPTIHVLGRNTASFGPINPGGDRYIVFITYPAEADPKDRCAWFSLNEYGVSLNELKKVAEGLRTI